VWLTPHLRDPQPEGERDQFYHKFRLVSYLVTELSYLLASIPLPVYDFVCLPAFCMFYSFDYNGLVGFGLGLGHSV